MISQRDLPGPLAEAGRLLAVDRDRRAARAPGLRGRLDHRRAGQRRRRRLRRAGEGRGRGGPRRHRPAALHRLPLRGPRRRRPAARTALGRPRARRLRSLGRARPAPAPLAGRSGRGSSGRGARCRGRRPWPRTSPRRRRPGRTRSSHSVPAPNIAIPTLIVIGGTSSVLGHVLADRGRDRVGHPARLHFVAVGEDDRELVAADPGEDVGLPRAAAEHAGDLLDHPVADRDGRACR